VRAQCALRGGQARSEAHRVDRVRGLRERAAMFRMEDGENTQQFKMKN
jgi:hypothetical protein